MKRIIVLIITAFIFVTCGNLKRATSWKNIGVDGYMTETFGDNISLTDLYLICERDTLSTNLDDWNKMSYYDDDKNLINQWMYIKTTDTNTIYILLQENDSTYDISIRKIIPDNTK